jgi:hypothetical protein
MIWFLACLSYLFGSLYGSPYRHNHFHVLAVDYDRGVIGQSLQAAYQQLAGPTFFTLELHSAEEYPAQEDLYQAVWEGKFWGSISVPQGASDRLAAALQGGEAATSYNSSDAIYWNWNQQYYTTFANSVVQSGMQQLVAATRIAYNKINGTHASQTVNQQDQAAVQVLLNPISSTARNIKNAPFGAVILLNTVVMAMPIIQQFFFLLVINGVMRQHQLYNKMTVRSSLLIRRFAGILFTLGAALCQTGYIWAFRENWQVNGNQFVLTWMTWWLLMQIHFLILDSISAVAPLPAMPFVMLLWIFLNLASALTPLELQAGFYHWGIALPSNNAYSVLVTIWTSGADNHLYRALPILFSWWVVANITTSITHIRACHLAYKLDLEQLEQGHVEEKGKDEEAAMESPDAISRQTTMNRVNTNLRKQRTVEEAALEERQVYGPSIPPFA